MENETLITEYTEQEIDGETGELLISSADKTDYLQEDKFTSSKVRVTISEVKTEDSITNDSI
jgi:hypothetical protein